MGSYPYPKNGYFVICDVCARKLRAYQTTKVTDQNTLQKGLIVCKQCEDRPSEQLIVRGKSDRILIDPTYVRPEQPVTFTTYNSAAVPNPPELINVAEVTDTTISLSWIEGLPNDSLPINSHQIERESPTGSGFSVIATKNNSNPFYKDSSLTAGTSYRYRIKSISDGGISTTGTVSTEIVTLND